MAWAIVSWGKLEDWHGVAEREILVVGLALVYESALATKVGLV